jgi:hypothetical protein
VQIACGLSNEVRPDRATRSAGVSKLVSEVNDVSPYPLSSFPASGVMTDEDTIPFYYLIGNLEVTTSDIEPSEEEDEDDAASDRMRSSGRATMTRIA